MAKQSYQSRARAGAWYCVLLNSSAPDNNLGRLGSLALITPGWLKGKVSDSHRNKSEAGERRPGKIIIFSISALSDKADGRTFCFSSIFNIKTGADPASQEECSQDSEDN